MDPASLPAAKTENDLLDRYLLCVDGAGVFLVCLEEEVTIGGHRLDDDRADICLMADLARRHVSLHRSPSGYELTALGAVCLEGQFVPDGATAALEETANWKMGELVEIQFRQPTVLSRTAVLDFPGSNRPIAGQPGTSVDRVILMDQNCLIGAGGGQHIQLEDCGEGVILYRRKGRLWCKSKNEFRVNDQVTTTTCALELGDVISGDDYRFRIDAV